MNTAERNCKLDPVPDISPDGDVVLVVGPRNVRLRIQSQVLRCASKVFGAMFGPTWSEGQGLSKESPREVRLVEDDADALRIICCVVHHRNDDVPQSLTPKEVLQIAIEADKYDLNVALKYATAQWLKPRGKQERVDMGYLLAAAFLFSDMDMFVAHALALILHYTGSYLEFLDDEITSQTVPWKMFYLLEERRNRMRAELCQLLRDGINFVGGCSSCGWGQNRSDKYKILQSDYGPLLMLEVPLSEIIKRMKAVSCEDMARKYHSSTYPVYYHEAPTHKETLAGKLETIKNKVGICLDCVRSSDAATPCRFPHE